jgi:hypothetical protein
VPPHEPLYQYQSAPVPRIPPEVLKFVEPPSHMVDKVAIIELAEVELSFTVILILTQLVVLQVPSARA